MSGKEFCQSVAGPTLQEIRVTETSRGMGQTATAQPHTSPSWAAATQTPGARTSAELTWTICSVFLFPEQSHVTWLTWIWRKAKNLKERTMSGVRWGHVWDRGCWPCCDYHTPQSLWKQKWWISLSPHQHAASGYEWLSFLTLENTHFHALLGKTDEPHSVPTMLVWGLSKSPGDLSITQIAELKFLESGAQESRFLK